MTSTCLSAPTLPARTAQPRPYRRLHGRYFQTTIASAHTSSTSSSDKSQLSWSRRNLFGAATALSAALSGSSCRNALAFSNPEDLGDGFQKVYGEATSASSYGGYGGNDTGSERFAYFLEIPSSGWKRDTVGKIEKATQGVDLRYVGGRKEKVYVTTLIGYSRLNPMRDNVINDLALPDAELQDKITSASNFESSEKTKDGQMYYDYFVESPFGNVAASVTCYGGRLYALFVVAPVSSWATKNEAYQRIVNSFQTIRKDNIDQEAELLIRSNM